MNVQECLTLTRAVAAICPAQKFDEWTPDAWRELLADLDFADARAAVFNLGRVQPFIPPCDIRSEVERIRRERCRDNPMPEPPSELTVPQYLVWLRETKTAIADGRMTTQPAPRAIEADQRFAGVFREVES